MAMQKYGSFPGVTRRERQMAMDIAVRLGLPPIRGIWYYVDPYYGDDDNHGKLPWVAMDSLVTAEDVVSTGDGIAVIAYPSSTTANTTSYVAETLTWDKNGITVVGVGSQGYYNQRARISSSAAVYALLDIQGMGNHFENLTFYNGSDKSDAEICAVKLSSGAVRNSFKNCDFKGSPATASAYKTDLHLSNAHENMFENCNFGNCSYNAGNNAAAHIYMDGASGNGQNQFKDCTFMAQVSTGTAYGAVKSGAATALNGSMIFRNCLFTVWQANTGLTAMASWFIGTNPTTGNIVVDPNCMIAGYAAWDSTGGNDRVIVPLGVTDGDVDPNVGGCP
jgi:hypothetical protein